MTVDHPAWPLRDHPFNLNDEAMVFFCQIVFSLCDAPGNVFAALFVFYKTSFLRHKVLQYILFDHVRDRQFFSIKFVDSKLFSNKTPHNHAHDPYLHDFDVWLL